MDEQLNYIGPLMAKILTDAPFIEADVTFDETREYPYMFNVTAFDTVTMKWVVVCRIRITKQTQDASAMCFRLLFQTCQKDQPRFSPGVTLHGVVLDWSELRLTAYEMQLAVTWLIYY